MSLHVYLPTAFRGQSMESVDVLSFGPNQISLQQARKASPPLPFNVLHQISLYLSVNDLLCLQMVSGSVSSATVCLKLEIVFSGVHALRAHLQ